MKYFFTKYRFFLSGAALILTAASCTSTLSDEPATDARAISFTPAAETRAAVETDFPDRSSFSVWGWYGTTGSSTIDKTVFNNIPVTKSGEAWTYTGGTQYWISGMTYNFYGVYPANVGSCETDGTINVTDFDCSATGDAAVDLMTATAQGDGSNPARVAMQFKHTLTRITFSAKLADGLGTGYSLQVKEIALWASNKGNMTQDMSQPDGQPVWTTEPYLQDGDDEGDINEEYNAYLYRLTTENGALITNSITTGDAVQLNATTGEGDLLVIPQKMSITRPVLAIRYALGYNGNYTEPMWKVCYLKDTSTDWSPGTSLNYTFTIDENNVYFGIQINDWESGNGGNEDIDFE